MKIIVFAKAPVAGQVKSRLAGALGAEGAAELHRRLVLRTLRTARAADVGAVELCCAPDVHHGFLSECAGRFGVELTGQGDGETVRAMVPFYLVALLVLLLMSYVPALTIR